jgi:hypothetical protein
MYNWTPPHSHVMVAIDSAEIKTSLQYENYISLPRVAKGGLEFPATILTAAKIRLLALSPSIAD